MEIYKFDNRIFLCVSKKEVIVNERIRTVMICISEGGSGVYNFVLPDSHFKKLYPKD